MKYTCRLTLMTLLIGMLLLAGSASAGAKSIKGTDSSVETGDIQKPQELPSTAAVSPAGSSPEVNWHVMSQGATHASSPDFIIRGTLVQTAVGTSSSPDNIIHSGFWQDFSANGFVCGDVNFSGNVDIDDIIYLVVYIFQAGPAPDPLEIGDVNCADSVDIDDIIFIVDYVFQGGPEPCAPCKGT